MTKTEIAANFLNLCTPRTLDRAATTLETLLAARTEGAIFNVDYKDAKDFLGRVVEGAWAEKVRKPFLVGRGFDTPESDFDYYLGSPSNLHDVLARAKKLARLSPESKLVATVDPEMLRAVREILDAANPVALLVKELKASVVKGRRPTAPSKATIAARAKESAKKTCPCCFRAMTVKSGRVVRHGWEERGGRRVGSYGNAWHAGECFGVGYAPFEVSSRGTEDFRAALLPTLANMESGLVTLEARPATLRGSYSRGYGRKAEKVSFELVDDGGDLENLTRRDARDGYSNLTGSYAWNLSRYIAAAKRDLEALRGDLDLLAKAIADWKPGV